MLRAVIVIVLGLLAGALVGGFTALLTRSVYVPILVPMFMGASIGMAVGFWANASEFYGGPLPWVATTLACLMCIGVFHYVEYADGFVNLVRRAHQVEGEGFEATRIDDAQARALAERSLVSAVGEGGFVGFLKLRAKAGLKLRGFGPGSLGSRWSLVIWGLDLFVIFLLAFRIAVGAAARGGR